MLFLLVRDHNDDACGDPDDPTIPRCGSSVSDQAFHRLDFWPTFFFAVVTACCFRTLPQSQNDHRSIPAMRVILVLEVGLAFVAAMLATLDLASFEIVSHEIEYVSELVRTLIDAMFLSSLIGDRNYRFRRIISIVVACAQLVTYNCLGEYGEVASHYCEFTNGLASSIVTFWFCMDNKSKAEDEMYEIVHRTPRPTRDFRISKVTRYQANLASWPRRTLHPSKPSSSSKLLTTTVEEPEKTVSNYGSSPSAIFDHPV